VRRKIRRRYAVYVDTLAITDGIDLRAAALQARQGADFAMTLDIAHAGDADCALMH